MIASKILATRQSWWNSDQPVQQRFESLQGNHTTEILVMGGGITGLTTALELAQRGQDVTVCDAQTIGAGTTVRSSAHLDAHPEMGPRKLIQTLGIDDAGCLHRLDPVCPHMGGVVNWNEAEQTWDCPLHGGRFTASGKCLYGPPESDLEAKS